MDEHDKRGGGADVEDRARFRALLAALIAGPLALLGAVAAIAQVIDYVQDGKASLVWTALVEVVGTISVLAAVVYRHKLRGLFPSLGREGVVVYASAVVSALSITVAAVLPVSGPSLSAPSSAPSSASPGASATSPVHPGCSPGGFVVIRIGSGAASDLPDCPVVQFSTGARWKLIGKSDGTSPCEFGLAYASGRQRTPAGGDVLVHGRESGTHTVTGRQHCFSVTVVGADDVAAALPITISRTARSGASPLFVAGGRIEITTSGSGNCNATLFNDAGVKQGQQVTLAGPVQFDVAAQAYFVEEEANDCGLSIRQE